MKQRGVHRARQTVDRTRRLHEDEPALHDERRDRLDHRVLRARCRADARAGRRGDEDVLAHISPAHSANINFFGAIEVDIEAELAALGPTG